MFSNLLNKFNKSINIRKKDKHIESKLNIAYKKAMQDLKDGNYKTQTAQEHIEELVRNLKN